jgi:hypothetical protein
MLIMLLARHLPSRIGASPFQQRPCVLAALAFVAINKFVADY